MSRSENYLKQGEVFQVLYKRARTKECQGARTIKNRANYFRYCTSAQELTNVKERELFETG